MQRFREEGKEKFMERLFNFFTKERTTRAPVSRERGKEENNQPIT